jgi:threonine dehydrogenase-like Zn-dependent dehydrogenase
MEAMHHMRALTVGERGLAYVADHPEPAPMEGEARVRVLLAGICNTDLEIVRGYLRFHGVLGHEFVGIVEEVYGTVAHDRYARLIGRRVVGEINAACGRHECPMCSVGMQTHCPSRTTLGIGGRDGAFAEYLTLPVENLHEVPDAMSDRAAVFVEPLAANFEMLEQMHVHPTDRAVVLGDGKMGQLAVQVLALTGCDVCLVGRHEDKLALARARGISTRLVARDGDTEAHIEPRADVVVECTGSAQGFETALRLVRPRGTILLKSTVADRGTLDLAPIVIDEIRVQGSRCGPFAPALRALAERRVDVEPLITATYPLKEGVTAFERAAQAGVLKVLFVP